jgi:hypothetical protein
MRKQFKLLSEIWRIWQQKQFSVHSFICFDCNLSRIQNCFFFLVFTSHCLEFEIEICFGWISEWVFEVWKGLKFIEIFKKLFSESYENLAIKDKNSCFTHQHPKKSVEIPNILHNFIDSNLMWFKRNPTQNSQRK